MSTDASVSDRLVTESTVETVSTDISQLVSDDVGIPEVPATVVSDHLVTEPPVQTLSTNASVSGRLVTESPVETVSTDISQLVSDDVGIPEPPVKSLSADVGQLVSDDVGASGATDFFTVRHSVAVSSFSTRSSGTGKFSVDDSDKCLYLVCCHCAHIYSTIDCLPVTQCYKFRLKRLMGRC